jgi:hypothetical protein
MAVKGDCSHWRAGALFLPFMDGPAKPVTPEGEAAQKVLDEAFARFRADYPEIARTLDAMNVSFEQYLATIQDLRPDLETGTGTSCTPLSIPALSC